MNAILPKDYCARVAGPCYLVCHGAVLVAACYDAEHANHAAWKHYHSVGHMEQCTTPLHTTMAELFPVDHARTVGNIPHA